MSFPRSNSPSLRLTDEDRRVIAFLTRYHRRPVPERRRDSEIDPPAGLRTARLLAGFLRAADALDGRRVPPPTLVFRRHGASLHVWCHIEGGASEALDAFGRRKKLRLLEALLGIPVRVSSTRLPHGLQPEAAGDRSVFAITDGR